MTNEIRPYVYAAASFGIAVLEEMREDLGDIDGGWLQDNTEELGLLVPIKVTEPCGEDCRCAEYGDFPQECLRHSDEAEEFIAARRTK